MLTWILPVLAACQSAVPTETPLSATPAGPMHLRQEHPRHHTLWLIGKGPLYLVYRSESHPPDGYQLVFEAELVRQGHDPLAVYRQDQQVTGEKIYSLISERFALPELFTPAATPLRRSFRAKVFRGRGDSQGSPLMEHVTVVIKRTVFIEKLARTMMKPIGEAKYFVFGNAQELFAIHSMVAGGDFEQILAVRIIDGVLNPSQAQTIYQGVLVEIANTLNQPEFALKEGSRHEGRIKLAQRDLNVSLQIPTVYYQTTLE